MKNLSNLLTFIILTKNEELNINRCIKNLKPISKNIIIVDSFSTDKTKLIAKKNKIRFYQNKFINQGKQFNWALKNIKIKTEWIMRIDADEYLSNGLISEIKKINFVNSKYNGFSMNKKIIWMGKWIKYGSIYPMLVHRIFRRGFGSYEEFTEENLIINGEVKHINADIVDDNKKNSVIFFSKKHLETGVGEMDEFLKLKTSNIKIKKKILGNKSERTRWLKQKIYNNSPLFIRCFFYFFYRYFFRLGFLDGIHGLTFHVLQGFWYRFLIDTLIYEKKTNVNKTL